MKLVLTGIQGSGKSTQGNLLSKELKIPYLSTGHIFREIAKEKTKNGRYVKELITAGELIPDEKTLEIVQGYLKQPQYKRGYILDGFPRTLQQAKLFENGIDKVIYLEIPDKEALWRLAYRDDVARDDNTIRAIRKRIEIFHQFTNPVIEYYDKKGQVISIDGTISIKEVNKEILRSLGKEFIHNHLQSWEQKQKTIIACVGLPGAGKSEAAQYFASKGIPLISFSKMMNDYIDEHHLKHTEEVHKRIRQEVREKYGMEALAVLNEKKIHEELDKNPIIIVEGMRSWEEYVYLKKKFPKVHILIIAVFADKHLRYERSARRKYRSKMFGEERDINELIGINMGPTIAFADFIITNNTTLEDLHDKLEKLYQQIYFL